MKSSRAFMFISLFAMLVLVLCAGTAFAADASDFSYTSSNGEVTITGYAGTDTDVVIPSEIDGMPVVAIGDSAFVCNTSITSVVIPEGVTQIGSGAFFGCHSVTEVRIPASVTTIADDAFGDMTLLERFIVDEANMAYRSVDGMLLTRDKTELIVVPKTYSGKLVVPDEVRIIHTVAVRDFIGKFTEIVLPDGIEELRWHAFIVTGFLTKINLPASLTTIDDEVFYGIGDDLVATVYEGTYAHAWCIEHGIEVDVKVIPFTYADNGDGTITITGYNDTDTDVVIPSKIDGLQVTAIGDGAFENNSTITSVTIPEGVTSIGEFAFWSCSALQKVDLPESLVTIRDYAFCFCSNLTEVAIPASTTNIASAFYGMPAAITVDSANPAYKVMDGVLYTKDGKTLKFVPGNKTGVFTIPEGTEVIERGAFFGCTVTEIRIPVSVKEIGIEAFGETYLLERFVVDEANAAYRVVDGMLLSKDRTRLITVPMTISGKVVIPEGVRTIYMGALRGWQPGITELVLPEGISAIEGQAIVNQPLDKINLPASLTFIDDGAFYNSTQNLVAQVEKGSYAHTWCVEHDIDVDVIPSLQLLPASRIDPDAIPFGMAAEVEVVDGLYHVTIDNEATDWDTVYTLQEPMHWYNPDTGESGVAVERVMIGAMFDPPEGAAYSKSVVGNAWKTDEEILQALANTTEINNLNSWINSWKLDTALFGDDGSITLNEFTGDIYAPYTYAILWLDENGEEMFAEKVEFCFEYTQPDATHTFSKKLIPAESIMGNVGNAEGVTCEITDGSIISTQMDANAEHVTEILAPENAVSYSMHDNYYDPWATKYDVTNGVVGFMRSGTLTETITTSSLICWYDADGKVIGGGWITFTSKLGEGVTVPEPTDGLQLLPASRIDPDAIPFGMVAEVEVVDGLFHVTIDNEATDWDTVYTLQEPLIWYNPDTGESGAYVEKVMLGAYLNKPEGAAYSKGIVGNAWGTDEAILEALHNTTTIEDLTTFGNAWWHDVALFGEESGNITLQEYTANPYPYTYAILWLDENGEEMFAEKVEFCFEYTQPDATHTFSKKLIPAESIMGNVENAEGVTCEITDGSIITTQMDANAEHVTEIVAPENAVSYSMHDNFYDPWAEKYEVTNGVVGFMRSGTLTETITTSSLICWYDADGQLVGGGWITFTGRLGEGVTVPEPTDGLQLLPVSRIDPDAIPFGMVAEVELVDGLYHVTIDNEATDWDTVYTLQEPMHWYNPDTGESGVAVERVMTGAMFDPPEGAAYSKSVAGNAWKTDEEILQALANTTEINNLNSWINSWKLDTALFGDDGSITLNEFTGDIYAPYTYAILWLDENGEEMFAEKVEFCFEYTQPDAAHTFSKKLIPAESIMGNVENAEGVTCEITDGSIITTQMDANAEHVTEILAPENAVSYSMHDAYFDKWATKYDVVNGVVGFMRSGTLTETITTSSLICWYDANGKVIGGGWITFTSKLGEVSLLTFTLPAATQIIEEEAFAGSAVQSVIIPDGCTAIGARAFADCTQLQQIVIPASVTEIAADAFAGCANVTVIAPEGSAGQVLAEGTEGFGWRAE